MSKPTLVIVGASYAGTQLAASARELGFDGRIVMFGEERHQPYQRPPLSKGLLMGKTTPEQLVLRSPAFFTDNAVELMLGQRVNAIAPDARRVTLADGSALEYDWLALTTGARCRMPGELPGLKLEGVHHLRTLDDAQGLLTASAHAQRVCVIGGGFIGLEVAAALRSLGKTVTVIEAQPRLLARAFPQAMSEFIAQAHGRRGLELLLGRGVKALVGTNRVEAVELADGARIECDLVVFGIGVVPNDELARQAGLLVDNGIVTDLQGRTSVPNILAIGDVAHAELHPMPGGPARMRLESIQAANDGARAAATALVNGNVPAPVVPWFWSDQADLKFQMAGLPMAGDEAVVRGDVASEKFSLFYLRDGRVVAAHTVNKPSEHMLSRRMIAAGAQVSAAQLADPDFDLKSASATGAARPA
jgi:3-phenylpropionate/trans-cinnamate dioxygenase ferredoxin reductase subunit